MMKRYLLFFSGLLIALSANHLLAQNINWNNAPETGFVFQISNREAQKLLTKVGPDTIISSFLHTQIDTFNVLKGWTNRPEKGHFILVSVNENKLHCEYTSVFPYQVLLLKEYNALSLQVLDLEGNIRQDAKVKFKTRRIPFDKKTNTYRIENEWFNSPNKVVTVELEGFRSVFNIEKHDVPSWSNDYYNYDDGPDFYSYMITDKNRYKPGERVRFKSYALSGSRNPIRKDLDVWLIKSEQPVKVGTVTPHRPGSFAGEVQLHDSLKLTLDKYYPLQLRDKTGRVVGNCNFKFENYDLHGNKLEVKLETEAQFAPASNYVTVKATNENGLVLKDARAIVTVLTENIREIFQPLVVLPDTLFCKEVVLNPDGETVVEIPSALFQRSNTAYYVAVAVLNSENRRMEAGARASHYFSQYELVATYSNDSILYQVLDKRIAMKNMPFKVYRDDSVEPIDIILPHKEKINPAMTTIRFESVLVSRTIRFVDMVPKIKVVGGIQKDSFNISIDNPQKLPVSSFVYNGSNLLYKGFGSEMEFKSKIEDRNNTYYLELLYSFGGSEHVTSKEFEFREDDLDISLNVPERVYPGQKVDINIHVKDDEGNPVSGVDLTALATTAKLNYSLPNLPYYGNKSLGRPANATYRKNEVNKHIANLDLDFEKWAPRLRLDTMKYYQFTYPGNKFFYHHISISDSTQFAPYVMQDGAAKQVHVVEVDHVPVYFSWTSHPKANAFYIEPDKYKQITLRLYDRVIILDSMCLERGKKTIFSIDLDQLPKGVTVHRIAPEIVKAGPWRKYKQWSLTKTETGRYGSYLAKFSVGKKPTYLESGKQFVALSWGDNIHDVTAGPVTQGIQTYVQEGTVKTTYRHTGGFSYVFEDNIVYKKDVTKLFPVKLSNLTFRPLISLNDVVINKEVLLEKPPKEPMRWHPRVIDLVDHACRVKLLLPFEDAQSGVATVLFQDCLTNILLQPCRSYSIKTDYFTIPRGCHHAIVLYNNGTYLKMDSISLQSHYNIAGDMSRQPLHAADSISRKWLHTYTNNCFPSDVAASRTITFQQKRNSTGNLQGTVLDDMNYELPGASVVVKGTALGAVTDVNGRFILDIPEDPSTLIVSFIGYVTQEIEVRPGTDISIVMQADIQELQEVVVIGYGAATQRQLSGSVAGVSIRIRGISSMNTFDESDMEKDVRPSPEKVREAEQKLYQELLTLKSIRSDFSDVAFWEPRLWTDRQGRCTFAVAFPDDLTRWDAIVYGMNRRLQTGTVRKSIKSYKPLMAELHTPQFLTVGDSANFIGKVLNYTSDQTIEGSTQWSGSTAKNNSVNFDSFHNETLSVIATSSDTITTRYSFTRNDGYLDGEERKVPVIEQGTLRANGTMSILKNGDQLFFKSKRGEVVNVEIFNNQLDLYAGEVRWLINYRYDCNEQLASKLIGLLNYKLLMQYEGKPFKHDKDVNRIVQRLLRNQNREFLWSWWDVSSNTSYWMSAHILRALKAAKDAGYVVNLDLANVVRKARYKIEFLKDVSLNDVQLIHALAIWNIDVKYAQWVRILDSKVKHYDSVVREDTRRYRYGHYSTLNEKLMLFEVRQLQNLQFVPDSLLHYKKETILNEVYFGDDLRSRHWYSGDISTNAIAYRIVSRDSTLKELTAPMQMYFLSQRRKGAWNTYEASNVLISILPDLIAQGSERKTPAKVSLTGKVNNEVQRFPFNLELEDGEQLQINKLTGLPLYCMQYTQERVTTAQAGTDAFKIRTAFDQKTLKAGTPAVLTCTIELKRDADLEHVMIEIPIPGGCGYADKRQFDNPIETHREYFKDKTVIFCQKMTAGTYVFQVQLIPRFTGSYHLNPAQVSWMYFPVINANTDMEMVKIRE